MRARIFLALLAICSAAACSADVTAPIESGTDTYSVTAPAAPVFDGTHAFGSGG